MTKCYKCGELSNWTHLRKVKDEFENFCCKCNDKIDEIIKEKLNE